MVNYQYLAAAAAAIAIIAFICMIIGLYKTYGGEEEHVGWIHPTLGWGGMVFAVVGAAGCAYSLMELKKQGGSFTKSGGYESYMNNAVAKASNASTESEFIGGIANPFLNA